MITFRAVTADDIEPVRALATAIWREHYPSIISSEQIEYMLEMMYGADVIYCELASGVVWEIVARDDEPVGYLSYTHDAATRDVKLHKMYVLPRLHGQGIGRQMLEHVKDAATRAGAQRIWLQVNKRNTRAIRAYERAGFAISGEGVFDIGGGYVMDDYLMTITIR